jgi:hypothetical protein
MGRSSREALVGLELAGIYDAGGTLERPIAARPWQIPGSIELEGDWLRWRWGRAGPPGKTSTRAQWTTGEPGLLEEFLLLANAPARAIRSYARRYGVLMLCSPHDRPSTHEFHEPDKSSGYVAGCALRVSGSSYIESLADWRRYARGAGAILKLFAAHHRGASGDSDDWRAATGLDRWVSPDGSVEFDGDMSRYTLVSRRGTLEGLLNDWLADGNVRPHIYWPPNGPVLSVGGSGLFGALAVQLMLGAIRQAGFAWCSACGETYRPSRKPRIELRRYCPSCRKRRIPQRDARRASKLRARARCLSRVGRLPDEIAEALGVDAEMVRTWLSAVPSKPHPPTKRG